MEEKVKEIDNKLKDVTNKMEVLNKSNKKLSQAFITKNCGQSSATKQGEITNPAQNILHSKWEKKTICKWGCHSTYICAGQRL